MRDSGFRTFRITSSTTARVLATATSRPVRVTLSGGAGLGGVRLIVGTDPQEVLDAVTGPQRSTGRIFYLTGQTFVSLVVDRGETLYVAGSPGVGEGATALVVSASYSDGLDTDHIEYVP